MANTNSLRSQASRLAKLVLHPREEASDDDVRHLAEAVVELDEALRRGGKLPSAWSRARRARNGDDE